MREASFSPHHNTHTHAISDVTDAAVYFRLLTQIPKDLEFTLMQKITTKNLFSFY
jgi:hypothetical protein